MTRPSLLRRLHREQRAVALIEFAFALPVLLVAGLMGLETANLVLAHMRMSRIASMTADNASRVRDSIDEADVNELMTGAQLASGPLDLKSNGRIILTDLQNNSAGNGQWIRWQRCFGAKVSPSSYGLAGQGKNDSSVQAMGPPGNQVAASSGTSVMFVELVYDYTPMITKAYGGKPQTMRYTAAYNVRKRPNTDPTNAGGLTPSQTAAC